MSAREEFARCFGLLQEEIGKAVLGQDEIVRKTLVAFFAGGHVLLEGEPGMGKTHLVKSLARALGLPWKRIQFTPDLMPADILGTHVLVEDDRGNRRLEFKKGPVFTHILLADEINRATPKTQAALLEAMGEGQVTIGGSSHRLPETFFVLATQNPLENEGTYPLPEAQLDRFFFKLDVLPPSRKALERIVVETTGWREDHAAAPRLEDLAGAGILSRPRPAPALAGPRQLHETVVEGVLCRTETASLEEELAAGLDPSGKTGERILAIREERLLRLRREVRLAELDAQMLDSLSAVAERSRQADFRVTPEGDVLGDLLRGGIGPRGAQALALAGKVEALLAGDALVLPHHVDADAAAAALAHRLPLEFNAERLGRRAGRMIVERLLEETGIGAHVAAAR